MRGSAGDGEHLALEAALAAHRNTEHFKKYPATTANMVADRNARAMSVIAMHSKGHG
jgi:quinol monooxygenase YgiN